MYDEPARPSPTPAPIAPPARAIPPPMKAPAVVMAELSTATVTPWFRAACPAQRVYLWCGRARRSGRRFWGGFAGRCLVAGLGVIGDSLVVVVAGAGHAEVEDGQQGEDEGLQSSQEQGVEQLPDDVEDDGEEAPERDVGRRQLHQRADQGDHDAAGEDVAEESQGQRDRLQQVLEDLQRQ